MCLDFLQIRCTKTNIHLIERLNINPNTQNNELKNPNSQTQIKHKNLNFNWSPPDSVQVSRERHPDMVIMSVNLKGWCFKARKEAWE